MTTTGEPIVFAPGIQVGPPLARDETDRHAGPLTTVAGRPLITDVESAPIGAPVMLVRGTDGLLRPDSTAGTRAAWSDPVRFRSGPPTDDPAAPEGARYVDLDSGRVYRRGEV